ncbi:MAG: DASS family sodium-coupled anion symporter [Sphingomonadaceae bacterium]|nr:DASS family sodium-coupled anion symporter [Sphingomonadaceae bacterium]NBU77778.1 DASS family sodium-coupled anion symporter [Sphingomonadaceae bacterium]NCA01609.1 DASS family sodium-coupled anion symporter [Sphingomonadaceae bacterium]
MDRAQKWGLLAGLILFAAMLALAPPAGMSVLAWRTSALVVLMAILWMTEALPLTVTALLPFVALPFMGVMPADKVAAAYYSPILFLVLGGAFIALAIERTGLHRRFALAILARGGRSAGGLLMAFMLATALISMIVSNTATALIMMPIAVAVLRANRTPEGETNGLAGALPMGIAFAASIGGLGTLVGSPTNAIAAGLIERSTGFHISFVTWSLYGLPLVAVALPICWFILMRVQHVAQGSFDTTATHASIGDVGAWTTAEKRLVPLIIAVVLGWVLLPLLAERLPDGMVEDGTIAILIALLLFIVPDGTGRPILVWKEADRAPWGVIMMFGGGLALAAGISASGLALWLGDALRPLASVNPILIALVLVAIVIIVTEFASNVATASGIIPVVGGLIAATGADPALLAVSAAMASSWGFMLPSGTGPNAIAWATGHIALPRMLTAGVLLDLAGIPLIVGVLWAVGTVLA